MTATIDAVATRRRGGVRALWAGNPLAVVQRGLIAARSSSWVVVFSGFFEPVFLSSESSPPDELPPEIRSSV